MSFWNTVTIRPIISFYLRIALTIAAILIQKSEFYVCFFNHMLIEVTLFSSSGNSACNAKKNCVVFSFFIQAFVFYFRLKWHVKSYFIRKPYVIMLITRMLTVNQLSFPKVCKQTIVEQHVYYLRRIDAKHVARKSWKFDANTCFNRHTCGLLMPLASLAREVCSQRNSFDPSSASESMRRLLWCEITKYISRVTCFYICINVHNQRNRRIETVGLFGEYSRKRKLQMNFSVIKPLHYVTLPRRETTRRSE